MDNQELSDEPSPHGDDLLSDFVACGFVSTKIPDGLSESVRGIFKAGQEFFDLPVEQKLQCRLPLDAGYRPLGSEYSQSPERPDKVESFSVSYRSEKAADRELLGVAELLRTEMFRTISSIESLLEAFLVHLRHKLTRDGTIRSLSRALRACSILQLNYSKPNSVTSTYINECHEDGCFITAILPDSPGLEIQMPDGQFKTAFPQGDDMFLLAGEIIWLLTNGAVSPAYHRVRPHSALKARMSLLLFADMHPARCSPWIKESLNGSADISEKSFERKVACSSRAR